MDAIILAGGKSSRMGNDWPKPLMLIKDKPLITYQINYLVKSGCVDKMMFALGYRADTVIENIQNIDIDTNYVFHPSYLFDFSVENEPLGTAGALKLAMQKTTSETVLVLNCDDIVDIDLKKFTKLRENTICVAKPRIPFGIVKETHGYAVFEEKPILDVWASCGWDVFNKAKLLPYLPDHGSLEYNVLQNPKLQLRVYKHNGYWKPLNTKKDIEEIEEEGLPDVFKENEK